MLERDRISRADAETKLAQKGVGILQESGDTVIYGYNNYPGGEFAIQWSRQDDVRIASLNEILAQEGLTPILPA